MDVPKTGQDYAVCFGVQFPLLATMAVVVRVAVREVGRFEDARAAETVRLYELLLAEKDRRHADRDARVQQLEQELIQTRARLTRSK